MKVARLFAVTYGAPVILALTYGFTFSLVKSAKNHYNLTLRLKHFARRQNKYRNSFISITSVTFSRDRKNYLKNVSFFWSISPFLRTKIQLWSWGSYLSRVIYNPVLIYYLLSACNTKFRSVFSSNSNNLVGTKINISEI